MAFSDANLIEEGRVFPSLECVLLEGMVVKDADWSPLVTFLPAAYLPGTDWMHS